MADNILMAPDVQAEQQRIARQQAMAQALMQQGMQNSGGTQQIGGVAIRNSPVSGLAQMFNAYLGGKLQNKADTQQTSLDQSRRIALADSLRAGLGQTDPAQSVINLSQNPDTAPYAAAAYANLLKNQNEQNKPLDLGDVAKFEPQSVATYQQTKNAGDLKLADKSITTYQQQDLDLRRRQLDQGQWQLDHDSMGNPIRVNKLTGETSAVKTEGGSNEVDLQNMIDGIGTGKIAPPSGLALRNPKVLAVMDQVLQKYPDYDGTTYATRQSAQKSWAPGGKSGDTFRAIGTANKHLDMVSSLVDALDNRDTQLLNKVGNEYTKQTGNPAPTNFDAAKNIVGQEVVKAIVANGGGVAEREEAAKLLDKAQSPAQLKGVIQTYRTIMGAQKESLLQQRRAAGLSDKTLPDYTEGGKTATVAPEDQQAIDWAKSNPNDPRAMKILQLHGGG